MGCRWSWDLSCLNALCKCHWQWWVEEKCRSISIPTCLCMPDQAGRLECQVLNLWWDELCNPVKSCQMKMCCSGCELWFFFFFYFIFEGIHTKKKWLKKTLDSCEVCDGDTCCGWRLWMWSTVGFTYKYIRTCKTGKTDGLAKIGNNTLLLV